MAGNRANSAFMLSGQILGKAGLFVSMMIYSRILEDGAFGELLLAVSIGFIVVFLSDMGATMLVTRRLSTGSPVNRVLTNALLLRTALSITAAAAVSLAVSAAGYSARQILLVLLVSLGFILDGFLESAFAVFRAREEMVFEGVARALHGGLCIALALFARYTGRGVVFAGAAYAARVVPALVFSAAVLFFGMKYKPSAGKGSLKEIRSLLKSAMPLGLAGLIIAAGLRIDGVFIKAFIGDAAIAAYQQCMKLFETLVLIIVPTLIPGALFPALCRAVEKSWGEARMRIAWMTELFLVIAFVLIITLWTGEEHILRTIWGDGYLRGVSSGDVSGAYRLLLATLPIMYMFHLFLGTEIAAERQKKVVPAVAVSFIIELVLFFLLVPLLGIAGAAVSHMVFLAISACWMAWDIRSAYGATGFIRGALRPVISFVPSSLILITEPFGAVMTGALALAAFALFWILSGGLAIIPRRIA